VLGNTNEEQAKIFADYQELAFYQLVELFITKRCGINWTLTSLEACDEFAE